MAETEELEEESANEPVKKASKLPLILGIVLAVLGGAGGFFAVQSGLVGGSQDAEANEMHADSEIETPDALPPLTFVALDPMVISLPGTGSRIQLRFSAQLEVEPEYAEDVESLKPRIVDVLNSYLRAVEIATLEDPTALIQIRSQMLRRVQIVTGEGRVKDLLIMEFVMT